MYHPRGYTRRRERTPTPLCGPSQLLSAFPQPPLQTALATNNNCTNSLANRSWLPCLNLFLSWSRPRQDGEACLPEGTRGSPRNQGSDCVVGTTSIRLLRDTGEPRKNSCPLRRCGSSSPHPHLSECWCWKRRKKIVQKCKDVLPFVVHGWGHVRHGLLRYHDIASCMVSMSHRHMSRLHTSARTQPPQPPIRALQAPRTH